MATQLQLRSGTTLQNDIFTGASGELTYDTEKNQVRIHDGQTVGGFVLASSGSADFVVAWQAPTEANEYTWYRKYKSGWVEQGGRTNANYSPGKTVTLPVTMTDTNYCAIVMNNTSTTTSNATLNISCVPQTTSTILIESGHNTEVSMSWQVSGMAA